MDKIEDRDIRQRDIIAPEKLATCNVTVVGVGGIGRQVTLQLAAIGVPRLQLVDPDTVDVVNLAAQGYLEADLGKLKVAATADLCRQTNPEIEIQQYPERFRRSMTIGDVLFCCVDSIATRKRMWEATSTRTRLFVDGRMSAEVIRVLAAADDASRRANADATQALHAPDRVSIHARV